MSIIYRANFAQQHRFILPYIINYIINNHLINIANEHFNGHADCCDNSCEV